MKKCVAWFLVAVMALGVLAGCGSNADAPTSAIPTMATAIDTPESVPTPTVNQTPGPTLTPEPTPTVKSTTEPTAEPTAEPTLTTSPEATLPPTPKALPTTEATPEPTRAPTVEPTPSAAQPPTPTLDVTLTPEPKPKPGAVYWTPGGKSYHSTSGCRSLAKSKEILSGTLQDAIAAGKSDPCNNCVR